MIEKIKELICNYVDAEPEKITPQSRFIEDLGFNSYDFMSMLGELEDSLGVTVNEEDILTLSTVQDAADYLEKLQKGE
ncbi:MAG: phosphopantetheine-binding protein [Ruminococcus sp.]|nr:phosphopantetheine-binding protein [Ruminococcus sp.]